jgi:hypothetical protein
MPAEDIARLLAARFLAEGNYEVGPVSLGAQPAAAIHQFDNYFDFVEAGFAGLAVQSVGHTAGVQEGEPKVVIHVLRGSRRAFRALPPRIDDADIEIDLIGRVRAIPALAGAGNFYEHNGRIACGSSCAASGSPNTGTFGALLRHAHNLLALSNNHVFGGCNHTTKGLPLVSPSGGDTRAGRRAPTEFARHDQIVELRSGDPGLVSLNRVDAALGIITNQASVTSWQGDEHEGFDTPANIVDPFSGMSVKKIGRTTGLTTGIVYTYDDTPWPLLYKAEHFKATAWFTETWTIRAPNDGELFALPGDSGSLVVTEDGAAAVGLLFASNMRGDRGAIIPIGNILAALGNPQLVSGHGV